MGYIWFVKECRCSLLLIGNWFGLSFSSSWYAGAVNTGFSCHFMKTLIATVLAPNPVTAATGASQTVD